MEFVEHFIYVHRCEVNRKLYVGYTYNLEARWKAHLSEANGNSQLHFHRAIRKHGVDKFHTWIVASGLTDDAAKEYEIQLIADLRSQRYQLYNMTVGGDGVKNPTLEVRQKMGVHRGKHLSAEHRANLSKAGKGRVFSEETRRKLSEAQVGKKLSEKQRQQIIDNNRTRKGEKRSAEARVRMSEAASKRSTDENRQMMSAAVKAGFARRRFRKQSWSWFTKEKSS